MKYANEANAYLSDLVVFYLKLHDLHWNGKGSQFVDVRKYTEAQYDGIAGKFDAIAELMIMHGEKPVSCIADYVKAEAEALRLKMAEEDVLDVVAVSESIWPVTARRCGSRAP